MISFISKCTPILLYKQKETRVNHKQTLDIESLVPQNHLVRKLNKIDLSFIYDIVKEINKNYKKY